MKIGKSYLVLLAIFIFNSAANAQRTEVTISFSEQFFDTLLDAMYQNAAPPEFSLAGSGSPGSLSGETALRFAPRSPADCGNSIKILRENSSTRTAVRFRDGTIYAPVAFTGTYSPPLVGCVEFAGYAESTVDLEFDPKTQKLAGRVRATNVVLNGTGGLGSSLLAKMVQNSIDKKLNPIEIVSLEKLSFPFTLQNAVQLRMRAIGVRHTVGAGQLNVTVTYEFVKGQ